MARKLKTKLELDTVMAKRNADKMKKSLRGVGTEGKKAGDKVGKGMKAGAKSTAGFEKKVVALGATYLGLSQLLRTVTAIVDAYNDAIALRDKFAGTAVSLQAAAAGPASQFKIPEAIMQPYMGLIAKAGAAPPKDFGAVGDLITAAASSGLIGQLKLGPKGEKVEASPEDTAKLIALTKFGQYTGAGKEGAGTTRLVRKGMGKDLSLKNLLLVLSQLAEAYRASESSNWGEFIKGAISGTAGMMEEGISFETAISGYAGLVKMKHGPVITGEAWRMVAEKFFTADDPGIVKLIDQKYGKGAYWKLKKDDPDKMFRLIMGILTGPEGEEKAKLFKQLQIPAEMGGRLSHIRAAREETANARQMMEAATPSGMAGELKKWRGGQRATQQAGETEAMLTTARAGTGKGKGFTAALRTIAKAERQLAREESPTLSWIREALEFQSGEFSRGLVKRVKKEYKKRGWKYELPVQGFPLIDVTGDELKIDWRGRDTPIDRTAERKREEKRIREVLGGLVNGGSVNVGVIYANTPQKLATNDEAEKRVTTQPSK